MSCIFKRGGDDFDELRFVQVFSLETQHPAVFTFDDGFYFALFCAILSHMMQRLGGSDPELGVLRGIHIPTYV